MMNEPMKSRNPYMTAISVPSSRPLEGRKADALAKEIQRKVTQGDFARARMMLGGILAGMV
jgi:hypothetical protein